MSAVKKGLGELLVTEKLVNLAQLDEARKEQKSNGGRLSSALIRLGYVSDKEMASFLGKQYSAPTVDIDQFEIDESAIKSLPADVCDKHTVMPVSRAGTTLVVAFADPSNMYVRDDLAFVSRCKIEVVVAAELSILKLIEKHYKHGKSDFGSIITEMEESEDALNFTASLQAQLISKDDPESAPLVKFVNLMLTDAIKLKASDIHVEPYERRLRVRYRIDGLLHEKNQPPPGVAAALSSRIKIMARLDIAERRRAQDGRIKVKTASGTEVDLRVSVLPTLFGEKIVLRILDKTSLKVDMTQLGLETEDLELFAKKIQEPQGLVLVTGPTGSGKTVTLYSALQTVNDPQINISTAEDPVEFNLDGINQVQVHPDIGFTFAEALRSFLRQDPDVILIGEVRDLETAEMAFKAASTGHLVLSTLHTNDAPTTISRLVDMGVAPYLITSTVSLIVAQRLAGRICSKCKVLHKLGDDVLIAAGVKPEEVDQYSGVSRGEGCGTCSGTGIKGRVAIFEVMQMTMSIKETILKGGTPLEIKHAALRDGMRTLRQAALLKLRDGLIALDQVLTCTLGDDQI